MATLWLHKPGACDFLVPFDTRLAALEFISKVFDKAFTLLGEEAKYTCDGMALGGVLVTNKEIPTAGVFVAATACTQAVILPAGYVPPQKVNNNTWYKKIAYVWDNDALEMIFEREPEEFYIFPAGFTMIDREEPYNFTKYVPNIYELDEELANYMMIV
jgi:hypothetical protein